MNVTSYELVSPNIPSLVTTPSSIFIVWLYTNTRNSYNVLWRAIEYVIVLILSTLIILSRAVIVAGLPPAVTRT